MDTKKKTVYIETTIPSYATARTSEDVIKSARQVMTNLFWEKERQKYNLYISQYVIDECAKGDASAAQKRLEFIKGIPLLPSSDKIDALAVVYQNILNIPEKSKVDSFHLAISVIEEMDYVLTWNFTHMGLMSYVKILEYNNKHGFKTPYLITPDALNSGEDIENVL